MSKTQVTVTVTLDVDGDAGKMARLLAEYLTDAEGAFASDYSYEAWGGYEGPFVTGVKVHDMDRRLLAASDGWRTR